MHSAVHLEDGQRAYFTPGTAHQIVQNPRSTTLLAFFSFCNEDKFAETLLYHEVPQYYTWANNKFTRRRRGEDVVGHPGIKKDAALGRVYGIHPSQSECCFILGFYCTTYAVRPHWHTTCFILYFIIIWQCVH